MVTVRSYAKINLTLDITGVKDGYHMLRSVVSSIDLSDTIRLSKRKTNRVTMHGMGSESVPPEKNNAFKAAELFSATFGTEGADVTVYKDIPMCGGLGGSSADAAGVLRGMQKLYGVGTDEEIKALADRLGSDTGYMLKGGYALIEGRGEIVTPIPSERTLYLLLFLPKAEVSTPQCYALYDSIGRRSEKTDVCVEAIAHGTVSEIAESFSNDLLLPAIEIAPEVQTAIDEAKLFSPLGVNMTGSGSVVYALFETRELCEWAQSRYKGKCRTIVTRTIVPKEAKEWGNPFRLSEEEIQKARQ
ncbi:MAG: 4-(cytidine 5'-diphospho)-2-C-methyl-D-erythritol kinase [Clostridia bacterium]|nr:4-(cytidine 5'-diphospho)-2-C-methyl-D-erythritol kinase [Clostridia bacterium]